MPSSTNYKRNYSQEYATTNGKPKAIKERAKRNAARAKLKKAGANVAGKDVDHKQGVSKGNAKTNLRVASVKANRSAGGKKGNKAGKSAGGKKGMASRWGKK